MSYAQVTTQDVTNSDLATYHFNLPNHVPLYRKGPKVAQVVEVVLNHFPPILAYDGGIPNIANNGRWSFDGGCELWGISKVDLAQLAADFYLLEFMVNVKERKELEPVLKSRVAFTADLFERYLNMALGGELRNCAKSRNAIRWMIDNDLIGYLPSPNGEKYATMDRWTAWYGWYRIYRQHGVRALAVAEQMFFNPDMWVSGYGGPAWGKITSLLKKYMEGKIPPKVFVDTTFSIQHNGGPVFNKTSGAGGRFSGLDYLKTVLVNQSYGHVDELVKFASWGVKTLWRGQKEERWVRR